MVTMKKTFWGILPMALLASCTSELAEVENNVTNDNVDKVTVRVNPFEFEDGTRTLLTASDNGITFSWANYDAIGVFPVEPTTNSQAKQVLDVPTDCEDNDAHYASFDGAGWGLKLGNTYAAYSPYQNLESDVTYDQVPFDLTGQDGTLATLGTKYDYMYAPSKPYSEHIASPSHSHEVVFDFKHAVSVIQLKLTLPVAADWKYVSLANRAGDKVFKWNGTLNVATGDTTCTDMRTFMMLFLNNVKTTAANQEVTLYMSVLPTTTGDLSVYATTTDGRVYEAGFPSKTLVAGKAYRYAAIPTFITTSGSESGHDWLNIGMPSGLKWATMNVGASSPTDYGNMFAWAETKTKEGTSGSYSFGGIKYSNNSSGTQFSKYVTDSNSGTPDGLSTLQPEDDAASANWGGSWRMFTRDEAIELYYSSVSFVATSFNNVTRNGVLVVGRNGREIFLPAAGISFYYNYYYDRDNGGNYWGSSLAEGYNGTAWFLSANPKKGTINPFVRWDRYYGMSIRPVVK